MAMFSNLNKETICRDLRRTSLTITCFSVWRQFQVGDRSRRRGWCTPRPPRAPPPTPRTWHVAASLERLPRMKKMKWLRKDKRRTHPHVPQVLRLLRILPVRVPVRVVLRVGVGVITVRVLAVWILASWLVPKFAWWSETSRLWSVSCWEGRVQTELQLSQALTSQSPKPWPPKHVHWAALFAHPNV